MTKQKKEQTEQSHVSPLYGPKAASSPPVLTIDYKLYEHYLEDSDMTEEQKRRFLDSLWFIICEFVALGFGVHPLQQAKNPCGNPPETGGNPPMSVPCVLDYNHLDLIDLFKMADTGKPEEAGKEKQQ